MTDIKDTRVKFGSLLRRLCYGRNQTTRALGEKAALSPSLINELENGHRTAGPTLSEKLAQALELNGETRQAFLLLAADTRKHDRLSAGSRASAPRW